MANREQTDRPDGLGLVDLSLKILNCRRLENLAPFARRVADMHNDIRDGVEVELLHIRRQRQLPLAACDARPLEGEKAHRLQIGLEETAVGLAGTGDDGLQRAVIVVEAGRRMPGVRSRLRDRC